MKRITSENYYNADEPFNFFGYRDPLTGEYQKITETYLIESIDELKHSELITPEIKEMIEVSKALFAYGYLYWSFLTLSMDQAFKAFEATISHVHEKIYGSNYTGTTRLQLSSMIDRLSKRNVIDQEKKSRYHNLRKIRNINAHPSFQTQLGLPAYDVLKDICTEIDFLFHALHNQGK
ncbi:hypothetical protein [Paenibacillus sp. FSL R5-0701]|uniref:DUF4145 domain-containing protein n=1 Tax=Paenibacillus sp. FSL R5-0701 TaxID=2921654 RepID=UPI0030CF6372